MGKEDEGTQKYNKVNGFGRFFQSIKIHFFRILAGKSVEILLLNLSENQTRYKSRKNYVMAYKTMQSEEGYLQKRASEMKPPIHKVNFNLEIISMKT